MEVSMYQKLNIAKRRIREQVLQLAILSHSAKPDKPVVTDIQ